MSAVWRAWWGAESHWNLGTGRGWSGSQSPHGGRTSAFQTHTKGQSSASTLSQEEVQRRELAKKLPLNEWTLLWPLPIPGGIFQGELPAPRSLLF